MNKVNQPVTAGRGFEQVALPNYTGEITILIHNIKSNNVMTGTNLTPLSTPVRKGTTDSVEFELLLCSYDLKKICHIMHIISKRRYQGHAMRILKRHTITSVV
jgi:hypothetical protein